MDVTQRTNAFIKNVLRRGRQAGWRYSRYKSCAQEELKWTSPDEASSVILSGWHGSEGWGVERTIHQLIWWNERTFKPVSVTEINVVDIDYLPSGELKPFSAAEYQSRLDNAMFKIFQIISK